MRVDMTAHTSSAGHVRSTSAECMRDRSITDFHQRYKRHRHSSSSFSGGNSSSWFRNPLHQLLIVLMAICLNWGRSMASPAQKVNQSLGQLRALMLYAACSHPKSTQSLLLHVVRCPPGLRRHATGTGANRVIRGRRFTSMRATWPNQMTLQLLNS